MGYLIHDVIEIVFIYSHSSSKPVKSMTKDTHIFGIVDGRKSMEQNSQYREYLLIQINNTFGRVVYTYTNHLKKVNPLEKNLKIIKYSLLYYLPSQLNGFYVQSLQMKSICTLVAGYFSTVLFAFNLFFKNFNLENEMKQHFLATDELWFIREKYVSLKTDFDILSTEDIISTRDRYLVKIPMKFTKKLLRQILKVI